MKTALGKALAWLHVAFVRRLESCLSPDTLYAVVCPYFLMRAIFNNLFKRSLPQPPAPDFLRTPRNFRTRVRERMNIYLDEVLHNFYDRLNQPKWLSRFEIVGLEHLEAARRAGRPVILVYWHFGTYPLLPGWMKRAIDYPLIPFVGGISSKRKVLARMQDQYLSRPDVPILVQADQLRELVRWVKGTNLIYIAIDVPISKQVTVPFCDGWDFQLTSGPFRLANQFGADLIACGLTREGPWRYRMFFSRPAPRELLADETDGHPAAGRHLIAEMLPEFKSRPEECQDAMIQRLTRRKSGAEIQNSPLNRS